MTILLRQKPLPQVVRQIVQRDNGAWFDPEDMSTMFQDAAGTTPVTALEQPVGLWLDKSHGLELGPELVTNGTFDTGTSNWVGHKGSETLSVVSSRLQVITQVTDSGVQQYFPLKVNRTYQLQATVTNTHPTIPRKFTLFLGSISVSKATEVAAGATETLCLNLIAGTNVATGVRMFGASYTPGEVFYIDNISVRELKGNHATQSVTASRPVISARKNWLLATDTLSTQNVTTIAAQQTLSFTGTGSITLSGTATGTLTGTGANNRVSLTFTPTAGTLTLTVSGDARFGQLEYGPTATTYQKVNTSTDYDTVGFKKYLKFDGIDDYLNLPYMGLYANGSASVIAAIDERPRSSYDVILGETNMANIIPLYYVAIPNTQGANFYAGMFVRNDTGIPAYDVDTRGNANLSNVGAIASIFSFVDSGANISKFHNSGLADSVAYARTGTGTFTDTKIGAWYRPSLVDLFEGSMYGLIITKSALTDAQRVRCERFLAQKSGVML